MNRGWVLAMALFVLPMARAQQIEKVQAVRPVHDSPVVSKPIGLARQVAKTARDFAKFRDPAWSLLTLAQIGAASADAATSLNNLHRCPSCSEEGVSRFFVGRHPDAHKYLIGGAIEIGVEAVAAHYFRNRGPVRKWYWRDMWALPQSLSLYEHAQAARRNAALNLACISSAPTCR